MSSSTTLTPQKHPIALRPDLITRAPATLKVQQTPNYNYQYFSATYADGTPVLSTTGDPFSLSGRKEFRDASGLPLYVLRADKSSMYRHMVLELPGDGKHEVLRAKYVWSFSRMKVDFEFVNAVAVEGKGKGKGVGEGEGDGAVEEKVKLELRGMDARSAVAHVLRGGEAVAVARKGSREMGNGKIEFLPEWSVDVAEGVDVGLISVIVVTIACLVDFPGQFAKTKGGKSEEKSAA